MPANNQALVSQSVKPKKFLNPTSVDASFATEFDKNSILSFDSKTQKDVSLGIQLEELYTTPYPVLLARVCESSGLAESDADSYLHFVINAIPKDSIK